MYTLWYIHNNIQLSLTELKRSKEVNVIDKINKILIYNGTLKCSECVNNTIFKWKMVWIRYIMHVSVVKGSFVHR